MPGFLSRYEMPNTVYLDPEEKWWVKYRYVITGDERDWLRENFGHMVPGTEGKVTIEWDNPFVERREETLIAIHSWNLTDENDVVLPFAPHDFREEMKPGSPPSPLRISWNRLPMHIQDTITVAYMEAAVEPTSEEDAQFPAGGVGGGEDGQDEAPVDRESVA